MSRRPGGDMIAVWVRAWLRSGQEGARTVITSARPWLIAVRVRSWRGSGRERALDGGHARAGSAGAVMIAVLVRMCPGSGRERARTAIMVRPGGFHDQVGSVRSGPAGAATESPTVPAFWRPRAGQARPRGWALHDRRPVRTRSTRGRERTGTAIMVGSPVGRAGSGPAGVIDRARPGQARLNSRPARPPDLLGAGDPWHGLLIGRIMGTLTAGRSPRSGADVRWCRPPRDDRSRARGVAVVRVAAPGRLLSAELSPPRVWRPATIAPVRV